MNTSLRESILSALTTFVNSRPGLEFGNYGDVAAYRAEMRSITKDRQQALLMLSSVAWRESITAEMIVAAAESSYSGRLTINANWHDNSVTIDYCAGQYWPTEYRRAVCALMSSLMWNYFRDNGAKTGDEIRKAARNSFGRAIASRWFN